MKRFRKRCPENISNIVPGVHSAIPHGQDRKVYEAILSGEHVQWQQGVRRRKNILALEMDGEFVEVANRPKRRRPAQRAAALEDLRRGPAMLDAGEELPALESLERDLEALIDMPSGDEAEDEADVNENADDGAGIGSFESDAITEEEMPGEPEGNDEDGDAGHPADPIPGDQDGGHPAVGDDLAPAQNMLASSTWGCFRITPKQPGSAGGGTFGGFEGACRFHKRSLVTGCKKFVSVKGPSEADRDFAFRQALFWLSLAPEHNRQRTHLAANITPPPSMEMILARRIDDAPDPSTVRTDEELDKGAAAAADHRPAGKARAKPHVGRPKGKAKAALKASAKAKAKAAAVHDDPGPDEAASDPPSSSSGSGSSSSS